MQKARIFSPESIVRRKTLVIFCVVLYAVCTSDIACSAGKTHAKLRLPNGEPVLRLPFPVGTVVLCEQGNCTPPPDLTASHRLGLQTMNCAYALDLTPSNRPGGIVAAAADGTVIAVFADSPPHDLTAGAGFGNQIKIDHGNGYFTFYAHLDTVLVKVGDHVSAGTQIGTVGSTGATGTAIGAQLHFSMHQRNPDSDLDQGYLGVGLSTPMHALIAADLNESNEFKLLSSLEFVPGNRTFSDKGHLYGSENDSVRPILIGHPHAELVRKLQSAETDLRNEIKEHMDQKKN